MMKYIPLIIAAMISGIVVLVLKRRNTEIEKNVEYPFKIKLERDKVTLRKAGYIDELLLGKDFDEIKTFISSVKALKRYLSTEVELSNHKVFDIKCILEQVIDLSNKIDFHCSSYNKFMNEDKEMKKSFENIQSTVEAVKCTFYEYDNMVNALCDTQINGLITIMNNFAFELETEINIYIACIADLMSHEKNNLMKG